jgi:L-malate glycosyltransferase
VRRLTVLHLVANRWWTGSADPALSLAGAQRARGHVVLFGCIRGDALEARAHAAGLPPVAGLSLERTARPWVLWRDARGLRALVRDRRIDVVHAHLSHDHWLAAVALGRHSAALVRTVHHRRTVRRRPWLRYLFRRTAAVLAASEGIAAALREAGVGAERITVVPGAVDAARFGPELDGRPVRAELGLGAGPVVGCVSRLVDGRGHALLLRAARRLAHVHPDLRLVLVGRGEGRSAVEGLVRELGLERVVVFTGYREDLPKVLAALDCFALLGGGNEESGRAVLEAMAASLPVVATRFGAMPETVVDGETGWLVDGVGPSAPDVVAERLGRLIAEPARSRAMGRAGRQRVTALFTDERRAALVDRAYAQALDAATDRPPGG